jgi:hypothetical protein
MVAMTAARHTCVSRACTGLGAARAAASGLLACIVLALPSRLAAHGAAASVLSVVQSGEDGRPHLVRLSEGLAIREGERYRYLCPALFDADEAPRAATLGSREALIAAGSALFVLRSDGVIEPHPDPLARSGLIRGLEPLGAGAVALRDGAATSEVELVKLDARTAQVLAQLPGDFRSLATAGEAALVTGLSRAGRALQRGFDDRGAEVSAWTAEATAPPDAVAVLARLSAGRPYALVLAGDGPVMELVRIGSDGAYEVLQRASVALTGPVQSGSQHVSIAFDGRLGELRTASVAPIETDEPVSCVLGAGAFAYACVGAELRALRDGALGERRFGLDRIAPPSPAGLDAELAEQCTLQWLRFRIDLLGAGVEPYALQAEDAGAPDAAAPDGGQGARGRTKDAGNGGCATALPSPPHRGAAHVATAVGLLLGVSACARRRRRRCA